MEAISQAFDGIEGARSTLPVMRGRTCYPNFALEAYGKVKHNRLYALDEQNKIALAELARTMFVRRIEEGRAQLDAKPTSWQEFFAIIEKLAAAGANILQKRPGDPKPLPKVWRDPVTNEPLPMA